MNRLDRFRFGSLHKRRIFMMVGIVAVIMAAAVLMISVLGFFGIRAELPRIRLSGDRTSGRIEGAGINVLEVPDSNIMDEPFFDERDICYSRVVAGTDGNFIYFDPSDDPELVDPAGGSVNVLSINENGDMVLRYSGQVESFDKMRFMVAGEIEEGKALRVNDPVIKATEVSGNLYLLTEQGRITTGETPLAINGDSEAVFTDMCGAESGLYAVTGRGDVYFSSDPGSISYLASCDIPDDHAASGIAYLDGNIIVSFDSGEIMMIEGEGMQTVNSYDFDLFASCDGQVAISLGNDIMLSRNGLFYTHAAGYESALPEGDRIICLETTKTSVYALTSYGRLVVVSSNGQDGSSCEITVSDISSIEPVSICPFEGTRVLAVTTDGQVFNADASDGSFHSLGLTGIDSDAVFRYGDRGFIIRSSNNIYEASVMSALKVLSPVSGDVISEGDTLVIRNSLYDADVWEPYGDSYIFSDGGKVILAGSGDGIHAMSRKLDGTSGELFENGLFYRMEIKLSSSSQGLDADVWLEGETFGREGFRAENIGAQEQTYSYVFAVSDMMLSDETLRFNIAFEGEAFLDTDDIYIGLDRYDIDSVTSEFADYISSGSPSVLRFGELQPGSTGFGENEFYMTGPGSLETAMRLCRTAGADPWLLIGSAATADDVDSLLGYLCGSVSNPYGLMRINNGTALPWSRQFDTLYIEISDSEDFFVSDIQKGAYVSYVMSLFARSEYYVEIKDEIIFVDGMDYEGGVMRSQADRHASSMVIAPEGGEDISAAAASAIGNARYDAPRSPSNGSDRNEIISSLGISFDGSDYTAADIVSLVISCESSFSDLVLFDSDIDVAEVLSTLRPLVDGERIFFEVEDPVDLSAGYSAEGFNDACDTILLDSGDGVYLIVANHSDAMQHFMVISSSFDTSDGKYSRFSSQGRLIYERHLNRLGRRLTLQPGEFMIIEVPRQKS